MIINDSQNLFYPVLTLSLQNFQYASAAEFGSKSGQCVVKAMISYYNASVSEWEPLIEKTRIEYIYNDNKGQLFNMISIKNSLNINLTT